MSTLTSSAEVQASDWRSTVARVGLIGRGLLYLVFGLLAIDIARSSGGGESSTQGAIERIAGDGSGRLLLIALCVGLLALVVWKALQAVAGDPVDGSEATDRAEFAIKGVVYVGALVAAVSALIANWDSSSSQASSNSGSGGTKQEATATVLEWPGGQYLVIAAGLGIIAFGLYELWTHAIEKEFMDRLGLDSMSEDAQHGVETAGRVGYAVKGATTAVVGGFLVVAGWQHDPDETTGISGALSEVGESTWGAPLLWVAGIGLIGYAAFSVVEAKYRCAT